MGRSLRAIAEEHHEIEGFMFQHILDSFKCTESFSAPNDCEREAGRSGFVCHHPDHPIKVAKGQVR